MPNDCPYCGKPHFNFGDDEEGVEMWINEPNDGEHVSLTARARISSVLGELVSGA